MESLKKARALKAQATLALTAALTTAAEAVSAAEAAHAAQVSIRVKREESELTSDEVREEKELENVIGLLLDIKKKRALAALEATVVCAPSTPDKGDKPDSGVVLSDELTGDVTDTTKDAGVEKMEVDELSSPQNLERKVLPKGNAGTLRLDSVDLSDAMRGNDALRRRLCRNLQISFNKDIDTYESLALRVVAAGDKTEVCQKKPPPQSCSLSWHDLELAIRGWAPIEYQNSPDAKHRARANQLKGAAERAKLDIEEHGGFVGLDAKSAFEIAKRARDLSINREGLYVERDPTIYHDGAVYLTDTNAAADRQLRVQEIEQTLRDQGMLRDEFPGLTEKQAREIIHSVKLGGEVVEIADDADLQKKKARKLPTKLATLKATPLKYGRK